MYQNQSPADARSTEAEYERLLGLREEIERTLERMIELLDAIDGDPDLEPTMGDVAEGYVDEAEHDSDFEHHVLENVEFTPDEAQPRPYTASADAA